MTPEQISGKILHTMLPNQQKNLFVTRQDTGPILAIHFRFRIASLLDIRKVMSALTVYPKHHGKAAQGTMPITPASWFKARLVKGRCKQSSS